jgi:hypothetical protein
MKSDQELLSDGFDQIKDEDFAMLEEHGQKDFVGYLKKNRKKTAVAISTFAKNMSSEAKETKEASMLIVKFMKDGKISPEEEKELRTQVYDLFKMVGIGIPFFMIPGSSLLLPFLIKVSKRFGVNLLPSSFNKDEENKEKESNKEDLSDTIN